MIHGDLNKPARQTKGKYRKKNKNCANTFEKCDQKKTDQQDSLWPLLKFWNQVLKLKVVQNEALLELEPVAFVQLFKMESIIYQATGNNLTAHGHILTFSVILMQFPLLPWTSNP